MAAAEVMTRRATLAAMAGAAIVGASHPAHAAAAAWQTAAPLDAGFAPDLAARLNAGVRSGLLDGLHAVLVSRNDHLVLERYYPGADEDWGKPLGRVTFDRTTLHDLRSVTKSIVGLLYGIALDRNLVPPPEASLLQQFPEYSDLAADPARAKLTVANALNMTLGLGWDESGSYADPANSEIAMEAAPDRNRYVLSRPIAAAPGTKWIYCGGAVALLGAMIARGSHTTLQDFARHALFEPLGITAFEWTTGRDGVALAASGLRLRPRDLLRIGTLVLADGQWHGRQIVSRAWLEASFRPVIATTGRLTGVEYGRLWYLGEATAPGLPGPHRWMAGFGNGGQRLWLMPDAGLAVAIFCGNYNKPDQGMTPLRVWNEIVLGNLRRA
ncbi:MAG TPA: serine hydrolase domain-containing protein [Acetobacteraceae bacterium]|jgi:CubicO group peptidase (beta-lactamase class C family)|nr:serine hydrolase domain-containing protein [Acetobacteraceae bacterium]